MMIDSNRLLIIEPCFFGELLVQAAVEMRVPLLLFSMSPQRSDELGSKFDT